MYTSKRGFAFDIMVEADKLAAQKEQFERLSWERVGEIGARLAAGGMTPEEAAAAGEELTAVVRANEQLRARFGAGGLAGSYAPWSRAQAAASGGAGQAREPREGAAPAAPDAAGGPAAQAAEPAPGPRPAGQPAGAAQPPASPDAAVTGGDALSPDEIDELLAEAAALAAQSAAAPVAAQDGPAAASGSAAPPELPASPQSAGPAEDAPAASAPAAPASPTEPIPRISLVDGQMSVVADQAAGWKPEPLERHAPGPDPAPEPDPQPAPHEEPVLPQWADGTEALEALESFFAQEQTPNRAFNIPRGSHVDDSVPFSFRTRSASPKPAAFDPAKPRFGATEQPAPAREGGDFGHFGAPEVVSASPVPVDASGA